MDFYNYYVKLCNSVGKKPSAVAEEIGLSKSLVTRWKSGRGITDATAQKIADYFGISVDELLGKKENEPVDLLEEFKEELQILRDKPDSRSLLKAFDGMTPEQVRYMRKYIESFKEE